MNQFLYKVFLKGLGDELNGKFILTFKSVKSKKKITIHSNLKQILRKLSESNSNVLIFRNIEEVITLGDQPYEDDYIYYFIILLKALKGKKEGYLFGNVKNQGDILIGIWPFNHKLRDITDKNFIQRIEEAIQAHDKYSICLIN